ncbi:MAG: asparagine synthase (glutamine-hydrolyzing), partial [Flavobacteriales bacterium]|nr:asparagine synthase (glutamine-hydrolyzing) [Flavobacteriales bacterium]
KVIQHRGPDALGKYETVINNKKIGLGHTRLSILDLSEKGNQPFSSLDNKIHLIYNGEVYNYLELKEQHLKNEIFISNTDTEVILKLYQQKGMGFIDLLNGDFSIAILDENENKFFLIRDRAGVKPLYFSTQNDNLIFGSEIKSILKAGVKAELATENLQKYFVFKYSPANETLFKNINRLQAAHFAEYDLNNATFQIKKYWEPKQDKYQGITYQEAQDEIKILLQDATEKRLIADVPVGTFLSGGLDSSIIASFLKDKENINHYCASKEAKDIKKEGTTSDFHYAQQLAQEWNLNMTEIPIGSDNTNLEQIRNTIKYGDDLIADGSQIPSFLITQQAAKQSKVILSGMGADELFLGYAGHQMTMLDGWMSKMPLSNAMAKMGFSLDQGKGKFKAFRRYLHKLGKYYQYPNYKFGLYTIVGDYENSLSVFNGDKENTTEFLSNYFPEGANPYECFKRFEYENFLQKNVSYLDRMTMANSVEGRVPFLDHRIIEFAHSIPRKYKLSNKGKTKVVLKDAFKNDLPNYVTNRRKAGFGMPLRSIFSSEEKINELLDRDLFNSIEGFSLTDIEKNIQAHLSGREDNSALIYALISFQEWYKMYINH